MAKTILICDDDPTQRRLLQAVIEREGYGVVHAEGGEQALQALADPNARVDVVLLDLVMPGMTGIETLKAMRERSLATPVVVLTAQGGIETVVEAMRAGACDFFVKPASPERILVSLRNAFKMGDLETEVKRLKKTATGSLSFKDMIAAAPAMRPVVRMGERAAASNIPVLITGESGVGKELLARAIQGASDRAGKPFITVNCGAIPENLAESILFGHKKGSFTGATADHEGKFREADGGTLFLDEIGELPLDCQVKLLRVLQEGEVDPVGAKRPVKVDVRIISATNRDLEEEVKAGRFREDLYYRLSVFPIEAPPLRRRKEDLPALVAHFITRFNAQEGRSVQGASAQTMAMLAAFDWPGNVRQLENAVFRAVVLCEGDVLEPQDFPQISGVMADFAEAPVEETPAIAVSVAAEEPAPPAPAPARAVEGDDPRPAGAMTSKIEAETAQAPIELLDAQGHLRTLEDIERDLIQFAIEVYAGHMSEVARRLGIGRSTLYRKVREHELEVTGKRAG